MPSGFSYCIAFPRKIKEIFSVTGDFFAKIFCPQDGKGQQAGKTGQRIRPEGPHWPQEPGKTAEKQHRPAQCAQHDKAPQLSVCSPQEKEEHNGPGHETVQTIQQTRQPGEAETKGSQQIIQQSGAQPQQNGLPKRHQLVGDLVSHDPIQTGG